MIGKKLFGRLFGGLSLNLVIRLYAPVIGLAGIDALTKMIALETVFDPPRIIELLPFVNIVPVWNDGVSFGFLQNGGDLSRVVLMMLAFTVGFGLPLYARHWGNYACYGGLMMAGGALGNGIDRIVYGRVVDFIDLYAGQWHWPAFNVADMAITTGAGVIIVASLLEGRAKEE